MQMKLINDNKKINHNKTKKVVRKKTLVFTSLVHRVNIKLNFLKFSGQKPLNSGGREGKNLD